MSQKSDQAVVERRLRPIYDLLDMNKHKKVIQEVDRLLKKQPGFACAKALKGLALLRLGKPDECLSIVLPLVEEDHTEENTLQALTMVFRELGSPEKICAIYERAVTKVKSEELLTLAFTAYVRVNDFQKQYTTALSLFKLNNQIPYFSWAIMSVYIKGIREKEANNPAYKVSLPLAAKMMTKLLEDKKVDTEHENYLYALILKELGDYKKLLDFIEKNQIGPSITVAGITHKLKMECLLKIGDTNPLRKYLEDCISHNSENWESFQNYVDAFGLTEPTRTKSLLDSVLMNASAGSQAGLKTSLYSLLYLYVVQFEANIKPDYDPMEYFNRYIKEFGHDGSFFVDVEKFLNTLRKQGMSAESIVSKAGIFDRLKSLSTDTAKCVQTVANSAAVYRYLYENDGAKPLSGHAKCFLDAFLKVAGKKDKEAHGSPNYAQDQFLMLACLDMADSFWDSNDSETMLGDLSLEHKVTVTTPQAGDSLANGTANTFPISKDEYTLLLFLSVLQYGLLRNPVNPDARLVLLKGYLRCGAFEAILDVLVGLDVKHVLQDSVGHHYIWKGLSLGFHNDAFFMLRTLEALYSSYTKESMEHVISAYKFGSWDKIMDFYDFQGSLLQSFQFPLASVEKHLLEYSIDGHSTAKVVAIGKKSFLKMPSSCFDDWDRDLKDCRDLSMISPFIARDFALKSKELSFNAEKDRLKVRFLILSITQNLTKVLGATETEDLTETLNETNKFIEMLKVENAKETNLNYDKYTIDGPWMPRLPVYKKNGHVEFILNFGILVVKEWSKAEINWTEELAALTEYLKKIGEKCHVSKTQKVGLLNASDLLEDLNETLETITHACIYLDCLVHLLNKNDALISKKKKKGGRGQRKEDAEEKLIGILSEVTKLLLNIQESLTNFMHIVNEHCPNSWEPLSHLYKDQVPEPLYNSILPWAMPMVIAKIRSSYARSVAYFTFLVTSKTDYIQEIQTTLKA